MLKVDAATDGVARLPAWADGFAPFGTVHLLSVLLCIVLLVPLFIKGLSATKRDGDDRIPVAVWCGLLVGINAWSWTFWLTVPQFDLKQSLPLHFCDVAALIAPVALWFRWRWTRTLLFFWGFGLCTQAFVTPTITLGPAHERFWIFWLLHAGIVGSAAYDYVVRAYRPALRRCIAAIGMSILLFSVAMGVNHFLGSNYAYSGQSMPDQPTIIDALGPWPQRLLVLTAIGSAFFFMLVGISTVVSRFMPVCAKHVSEYTGPTA